MRLSKKYPKIMLIGTGIAFIMSGIDCIENELIFIAVLSFAVGIINIAASIYLNKYPFFVKIFLLIINAVFAFLSCYIYIKVGRDRIQYGWALVGIVSIVAIYFAYVKRARERK
jgi:hypothetical protein